MTNSVVYLKNKEELALFVSDLLCTGNLDWQSITIISPEKSEGYCVRIVTDGLSVATVRKWVQTYYGLHMNTSQENTQAG